MGRIKDRSISLWISQRLNNKQSRRSTIGISIVGTLIIICFFHLVILYPPSSIKRRGEDGIVEAIRALLNSDNKHHHQHPFIFVEMGANDGYNSNTYTLEHKYGWKGLCIEAAPGNYAQLIRNRPHCETIHAVVSNSVGTQVFREFSPDSKLYGHSGLLSMRSDAAWQSLLAAHSQHTVGGGGGETTTTTTTTTTIAYVDHNVQTMTLADIFSKSTVLSTAKRRSSTTTTTLSSTIPSRAVMIDYFSLDVEGAEMLILRDYPFESFPVNLWTIESNKLNRSELIAFMKEHNYHCWHYDAINTICQLVLL
jgi:hypothetical protein